MTNDSFLTCVLKHAKAKPNQIIIKDKWNSWTWSELLKDAERFATSIKDNFTTDSDPAVIPILVGRSGKVVSAILGCMLTKNAFAPLSMDQPTIRTKICLKNLGKNHLLSALDEHEIYPEDLKSLLVFQYDTATQMSSGYKPNFENNTLYVLFTSGSTGEPKGVSCSHKNIMNTILWSSNYLNWNETDVMGCGAQFTFDLSMFDIFSMMYFGIPIMIFPNLSNPKDVLEHIVRNKITSIFSTPAFFAQFLPPTLLEKLSNTKLRRIISAGDFFPPKHVEEWQTRAPDIIVYNSWGLIETSIITTMCMITKDILKNSKRVKSLPIGQESPRMPLTIIDEDKTITKSGEVGELWVLGDCVSMGYLDSEETSKQYTTFNNMRAFRTGDLGYKDENNNFFLVGRADSRVKIAGYRIELNEVENAVNQLSEVHLTAAFVQTIKDEHKEIWVGIELKKSTLDIDIFSAKKRLRKTLPQYTMPKRLFALPSMPLNINGKVDRLKVKQIINENILKKSST